MAQGALILTSSRCGGGFLASCLSSHPEMIFDDVIFWLRGLHVRTPTPGQIERLFKCLLNRDFCVVSGTKVYLNQIEAFPQSFWLERNVKIIVLERRNAVRVIFASEAKKALNKRGQELPIEVDVDSFVESVETRLTQYEDMQRFAEQMRDCGLGVLQLSYAEIVGSEGRTANKIPRRVARRLCDFLGVKSKPLVPTNDHFYERQHPIGLRDGIINWSDLKDALTQRGWQDWVRAERIYR